LYNRYQQRMFAFDHPTMSESPEKNINWFFRQLPNDANLNVDIVCHSRGGLVSRELARRTTTGRPSVSVDRIVFVAAPNAGTILTDGKHMNDFIDSYTNLLQLFPDNAVTDTLEAIIAVVKQLAVDILEGLEGLESMLPNGKVLQGLDAALPEKRRYFALASNFEPGSDANIAIRTADGIIDRIFEKKANDLVVPTDGVYQFGPAGGGFGPNPDERLQLFKGPKAPAHTRFFADPLTQQSILKWLA